MRSDRALAVAVGRGPLPHDLLVFVDLKARKLEVFDHLLGEPLPGIVGDVLCHDPPEQRSVLRYREADLDLL